VHNKRNSGSITSTLKPLNYNFRTKTLNLKSIPIFAFDFFTLVTNVDDHLKKLIKKYANYNTGVYQKIQDLFVYIHQYNINTEVFFFTDDQLQLLHDLFHNYINVISAENDYCLKIIGAYHTNEQDQLLLTEKARLQELVAEINFLLGNNQETERDFLYLSKDLMEHLEGSDCTIDDGDYYFESLSK
jgi:hypothetical protein